MVIYDLSACDPLGSLEGWKPTALGEDVTMTSPNNLREF